MADLNINALRPGGSTVLGAPRPATPAAGGDSFAALLRDQLAQVSQAQSEADENLKRVMTGESDGVTDALVSARKADVAFSLLMEIRNKLVDAYTELQNMRV